jgi:hypothetical protein
MAHFLRRYFILYEYISTYTVSYNPMISVFSVNLASNVSFVAFCDLNKNC